MTTQIPDDFDPFAGPSVSLGVPSTEPQREIWTATQIGDDASLAYNESVNLRLRGPLDAEALALSLRDVVQRHEALRAMFGGDGTTLLVAERAEFPFERVDLSGLDARERTARLDAVLTDAVSEPFDLLRGPLFRAWLVKLAEEEHVAVLSVHHIVCDGWSTAVILREWASLYSARVRGRLEELPPPARFSEYALWQADPARAPERAADEAYWLARFATGEIPVLELPLDHPRPARKTYTSRRLDRVLGEDLVSALKKTGAKEKASLFAMLLAGFYALMGRLAGQEDLVVGIPAAGQNHAGLDSLVGHCVSMLPLRAQVAMDRPMKELVAAARGVLLDAYDHQGMTLGSLLAKLPIARDPSRLPLVSVIFNVDRGMGPADLPFEGLACELHATPRLAENYEIFLNAVELGGKVTLECQYNTDLFEEATVDRWLAAYERLLRAAADSLETTVGKLPLLSRGELELIERVNAAAVRPWSTADRAHDLVFAQIARTPDAVAVELEGKSLTYRELGARARALGEKLRAGGVKRGELVGLCVERGPDMLVGLLGILEAGAAYVPLDPGYPAERLAFMVEDARMPALVTESALAKDLPFAKPGSGALREVVLVDTVSPASGALSARGEGPAGPEDPCYVIYTSGSTGKPKGVLVPHRAVANLLRSVAERPGMTSSDVVLAVTTLSFDIAVSEVLLPLTVGARIVLASRDVAADGDRLLALLERSKATFLDATPATYRLLLGSGWNGTKGLEVICTGEAMPRDLGETLLSRADSVWNGYGPTETCVWSTFWKVEKGFSRVLVGTPVANTQVYVLDARGERVPLGAVGELFIAGTGVALGYHDRPDLTEQRFVPDPFGPPGARMYKTGDLVRMLPNGDLECLGRNDNQVKLRGFRIELGEIEEALTLHPSVRQAAVIVREDRPNDRRLVGYLTFEEGKSLGDSEVRAHLKKSLPDYMVPQTLVRLERMPLTPSGKIDRKSLPAPSESAQSGDDSAFVAPRTDTESMLALLWQEVLGLGRVGVEDDFFSLGGHSLLASQMLARLKRDHGVTLTFRTIFEAPTIAKLAERIDAQKAAGGPKPQAAPTIVRRSGTGPAKLSMAQQRLWLLEEMDPGQKWIHVLPAAWRLDGRVDLAVLQRAIDTIVARHDTLRTQIRVEHGEPVQVVVPERRVVVEELDWRGRPDAEVAMQADFDARMRDAFDLEKDVLMRIALYRLADDKSVLFTMRHNIVWDGWSFDLFLKELAALYSGYARGEEPKLPELPITYADYAEWQSVWMKTPEIGKQVEYWKAKLAGNPAPLDLPTDRPRGPVRSHAGNNVGITISRAKADALTALAKSRGATLYMMVLSAFEVLLHRYTGQTDLLVGTPVRARTQAETEDIIGPFINAVVLRTHLRPDATFVELLEHLRDTTLDAFSHQEMPLELLGDAAPVVRAFFSLQDARNRPPSLGDLTVGQVHVLPPAAANELMLWTMDTRTHLLAMLNYSTDLFDEATARRLLRHLETILDGVLANPKARIGELPLSPQDELAELAVWHGAKDVPARSLVDVFAAVDSPASRKLRRLARWLMTRGARPGARVAVRAAPSEDAALACVAAMLAGATLVLGGGAADVTVEAVDAAQAVAQSDAPLDRIDPAQPAFVVRGVAVPHALAAAAAAGLAHVLSMGPSSAAPAQPPSEESGLFALLAPLAAGGAVDPRAAKPLANVFFARDLGIPVAAGDAGSPHRFAQLLPGLAIEVRDAHGSAPVGVPGTLVLVAPGGERITRDRVRTTSSGALEHVGREDGAVEVDGSFVDLVAMGSALRRHPALVDAHVAAAEPSPGAVRLVAWVVPRAGTDATESEWRKHLRDAGFGAVPRSFVELESIPRLPDGAVDAQKLPSVRSGEEPVPPRTSAERYLAAIWREVLGAPMVGARDNFFDLGGHSLLLFRVIARVEREQGKRLSPRAFLTGSLEQVAAELGEVSEKHDGAPASAAAEPARESAAKEGAKEEGVASKLFGRLKSLVPR
jgi:amino acid adenylation domain-containing protein